MPEPADQPAKPLRTWLPMALWTAALLLALGLIWSIAAVVVPVWRTHATVRAFQTQKGSEAGLSAINNLGGQDRARKRLLLYLGLPKCVIQRRQRDAALRLLGHSLVGREDVFLVMLSPDGLKAFTSGILEAAIWDLRSGRQICLLGVHCRYESSGEVAWSPDSQCVATTSGFCLGSYTRGATVWDAKTGKARICVEPDDTVSFVTFSSDGKYFFTGGSEHNVNKSYDQLRARACIWNASTGKRTAELQVKTLSELASLSRAVFSADGSTIRLVTDAGTRAFSCETGEEIDIRAEGKAKYGRGGE